MAKASDLRSRLGTGGVPANPTGNTVHITPTDKDAKKSKDGESVAAKKLDLGHNISAKAGKAQGGGSGSAGRPKV